MSSDNKTLVVAFDGLDKNLIEKFDLKNLQQAEVGEIDNHTNISKIYTSELFASFITGETYEKHGVKGLSKIDNSWKSRLRSIITPDMFVYKVPGFHRLRKTIDTAFEIEPRDYVKEDIQTPTIFDKVENSRAMFVPTYKPSGIWLLNELDLLNYYSKSKMRNWLKENEYNRRKEALIHELESEIVGPRDFLMCHFHYPDNMQHMYGDPGINQYDESVLEELYTLIDRDAAEIKEKALEAGYDRIIFMSDHGLPDEKPHNRNAFYSCNTELFSDKKPHITDFYDKFT